MQLWFASADRLIRSTQVDNTSRRTSCRAPGRPRDHLRFLDDGHGRRDVECHESEDAARSALGAGTHRTQTALDASGKCRRL
jgi:hypothetical protein